MRLSDAAHARSLPQQLGCALLNGSVSWVDAQTHFSAPRLSHMHMGSILHTRGSFSTRWRTQRTRNPARSGSAQPERTPSQTHTRTHTHRAAHKKRCVLFLERLAETQRVIYWSRLSVSRRGPELRLGAERSDLSSWAKRTKNTLKDTSVLFISCRLPPPLLAISFLLPAQGPGLSPSSEDERQLDLGPQLSACFWIYFAVEGKRGPGAEQGAQLKPRSSLSRLSSSSLHLSIYQSVLFCLSPRLFPCF